MKTKRNAPARPYKSKYSAQNKSYGVGGAVLSGVNSIMNKQKLLPSLLNAGKAFIDPTPMSTVTQGLKLGSTIAGKSKNPAIQNLGKLSGLASTATGFLGGGGGQNFLQNIGGGQGFQNFLQNIPGTSGANGMRVKSYEDGGKPKLKVKHLLEALEQDNPETMNKSIDFIQSDDKRGLNKFLNQEFRQDIKLQEQEGNEELAAERAENRDTRKALNQDYREDLRVDDSGEEEIEGEGGIDKEQLKKILQALAAGGVGFGAMVGAPKLINLLKKARGSVDHYENYNNTDDPMPGPRDPFWRQPSQSARGRNQ